MFTREDLAKAAQAARNIQADSDEILHKVVDNEPVVFASGEPQRGRPWLIMQVEPEVLLMHAACREWSANRNRTGSKFYILDGDGREIGVMYNEPDVQLLCQAVNEYHGLCLVEQARSDAVTVIHQYEALIAKLRKEVSVKDEIIARLQRECKVLGDQLEQDQAQLDRYQAIYGVL